MTAQAPEPCAHDYEDSVDPCVYVCRKCGALDRRAVPAAREAAGGWSPEPWTYDTVRAMVRDADGVAFALVSMSEAASPNEHANGHRIVALSSQVERLRSQLAQAEDVIRQYRNGLGAK